MDHHPAADIFPMLNDAELRELADDIAANGLREAAWVYDDPELGTVVLDGRNRLAACAMVGAQPLTRTYTGNDPVGFAVSMNVKRRHLTPGQLGFVAQEILPLYEAEAARRYKLTVGRPNKSVADLPPIPKVPLARDRAAKAVGTSSRVVAQAKRVAEHAPDLAAKVKAGELAIDRADRIIRDRDANVRRQDEAAQQAAHLDAGTRVDIRHGDFREVLADLENVDAVITDPPYPREFLPLLADLATWADNVLAPDGVLAVLMGEMFLPDVYRLLDGPRPYRWTACYLTPGPGDVVYPRKVQSNWKPLLIYGAGRRFGDVFRSEATDADAKDRHKWGQDYGAFHEIVSRLTRPGQTVADPFMGSGTTLLAAKTLGRHAIGCDIDGTHVDHAREWLT